MENKDYAKELKKHRKMAGLTLAEISKISGININSISRYERGTVLPTVEVYFKLISTYKHQIELNYIYTNNVTELKQNIKTIRKSLGMTQTELAEHIGVHSSTISNYELGYSKCPKRIYEQIVQMVPH